MMSDETTNGSEQNRADAFRALADRIRDADQQDVWDGFGRDLQDAAREGYGADVDEWRFAGIILAVNPRADSLETAIHPDGSRFGESRDIRNQAVPQHVQRNGGAFAVFPKRPANPVEQIREAVADALDRAADASEEQ